MSVNVENNRGEVINLLSSVNRYGINNVKVFLEKFGFYTAPASSKYKTYVGGLCEHSLNVYKMFKERVERLEPRYKIPPDSVIICGLLHDVRKIMPQNAGRKGSYGYDSVKLLESLGFNLTKTEKDIIHYHTGVFDIGKYTEAQLKGAIGSSVTVQMFASCDNEDSKGSIAGNLIESCEPKKQLWEMPLYFIKHRIKNWSYENNTVEDLYWWLTIAERKCKIEGKQFTFADFRPNKICWDGYEDHMESSYHRLVEEIKTTAGEYLIIGIDENEKCLLVCPIEHMIENMQYMFALPRSDGGRCIEDYNTSTMQILAYSEVEHLSNIWDQEAEPWESAY